jgi:threonine dehydrogenase-like Zn-dependent dehydrogenase
MRLHRSRAGRPRVAKGGPDRGQLPAALPQTITQAPAAAAAPAASWPESRRASVAVYGGGPVGQMAAYSALIRGASKVFVVERVPERLRTAERIGAIPINFQLGDPVQQIKEQTNGEGTDLA